MSEPAIGDGFIPALVPALVGLARDTGFLQRIGNSAVQFSGTAQVPIPLELTARALLDRAVRRTAVNDRVGRASAAKLGLAGPVVAPLASRHQLVLPGTSAAARSASLRSRQAPMRAGRAPPTHDRVAAPAPAGPIGLTLSTGGPAVAASGGIAAGTAAVVLVAVLALQILQLLSDRLSLELGPWRSTLLTLRLERPG